MFWKVLAGAATGVAVVVALPVAGPIGAITAVGAAVAGTVGAAGGAVADALDDSEEDAEKRGEQRGEERQKAKYAEAMARLKAILEAHRDDAKNFHDTLVAMFAVGLACASCDGEIHDDEREELEEFVAGVSAANLPSSVKSDIRRLWNSPPNIKTAYELAKRSKVDPSRFDDIIDVVMRADGREHPGETAFRHAWQRLSEAA